MTAADFQFPGIALANPTQTMRPSAVKGAIHHCTWPLVKVTSNKSKPSGATPWKLERLQTTESLDPPVSPAFGQRLDAGRDGGRPWVLLHRANIAVECSFRTGAGLSSAYARRYGIGNSSGCACIDAFEPTLQSVLVKHQPVNLSPWRCA